MLYRFVLVISLVRLVVLGVEVLDPLQVDSSPYKMGYKIIEEAIQINTQTMDEKLFNSVVANQIEDATNGKLLSIRGNNFRATDYYEDGIPLFKTGNGFTDLTMYNTYNASIMINPGAWEGLYGTAAIGGDVYITTKEPEQGVHAFANMVLSTNRASVNTVISQKSDDAFVQFECHALRQEAFRVSKALAFTPIQPDVYRVNSDIEQINAALKVGHRLSQNATLSLKVAHLQSVFGNPINIYDEPSGLYGNPSSADYTRVDDKALTNYWVSYDLVKSDWEFALKTYYDRYKDLWNFYDTPQFLTLSWPKSTYHDTRLGAIASLKHRYTPKQTGSFALRVDENTHRQVVENDPVIKDYAALEGSLAYTHRYDFTHASSMTALAQYKKQYLTHAHQFTQTAIPYKNNEGIDAQLTLNHETKNYGLYASVSRKNRFASLVELYPFFPWDEPNVHIRPERSTYFEIGGSMKNIPQTMLNASLYANSVDDKIVKENLRFANIEHAAIYGLELSMEHVSFKNHHIEASYAYTHAYDKNGLEILQIPRSKFFIYDSIAMGAKTHFVATFLYVGARYDSYNFTRRLLDDYTLLDMQVSYDPHEALNFTVGVRNAWDTNWAWAYGQPAMGRSFFMALKYRL